MRRREQSGPGRTTALTTAWVQKGQTCGDHVDGDGAAAGDGGAEAAPLWRRQAARLEATPSIRCRRRRRRRPSLRDKAMARRPRPRRIRLNK